MPQKYARTCARCDAPLPNTPSADGSITCSYCGSTTSFAPTSDELKARAAGEGSAAIAATLTGLAQQVEHSARMAARAQLPHLEQELRQVRETRLGLEREVEVTSGDILAQRGKAAGQRNGLYVLAILLLIGGAAGDAPSLGVVALVVFVGAWIAWRARKDKFQRLERTLFNETEPTFTELRDRDGELVAAIQELRRK